MAQRSGADQAFEQLEQRRLLAAPVVADLRTDDPIAIVGRPIVISAEATDDTGVRAVTFWLDFNRNGVWDSNADQTLGTVFAPRPGDGRYAVTAQVDASWPADAHLRANAVDIENNWGTPVGFVADVDARPVVRIFYVEPDVAPPPGTMVVDLFAKVSDELSAVTGGVSGVTFFYDRNRNGMWDAGTDTDLGFTSTFNNEGFYTKVVTVPNPGPAPHYFGASARDARALTVPFGQTASAVLRTSNGGVPTVTSITWTNLTQPGNTTSVTIGDTVRFAIIGNAPLDLAAVTLFFDRNSNGLWDPTFDTSLGNAFFGSDIISARGYVQVVIQPFWNFDWRTISAVAKDRSPRGADVWGPATIKWIKVVSPPWSQDGTVLNGPVTGGQPATVEFTVRDDHAARTAFGFIDTNGNNVFDAGENNSNAPVRLSSNLRNGRWQLTLGTSNLAPGTYHVGIQVSDFEGAVGRIHFFDITIV